MKRRRKNQKRERAIMLCSSVLVLTALTMTGVYVKGKKQEQNDGYVVDLSQLESENIEEIVTVEEPTEDTKTVSSTKVENRENLWDKEEYPLFSEENDFIEESAEDVQESGFLDFFREEEELKFSETDQLLWPIVGNILINYSMENPVYFATLEQYKCNPAIIIQAKAGQDVTAAARGKVVSVKKTEELGNVITVDLGSGYEILYGQLDNIQVKEGDLVEKGEYIAQVAKPTKYYTVEGENIYFALKKNGEPLNPLTKLQ